MLGSVVSKAVSQTMELLHDAVDSLVTGSSDSFHPLICIVETIWSVRPSIFISICTLCKEEFIRCKRLIQSIPADCQIGPVPRRIWSIDPNNPASLDAGTDLVSKTGVLELLAVPLLAPWGGFIDFEIRAIDSNKAKCPNVAPVSVLPLDLSSNKEALV